MPSTAYEGPLGDHFAKVAADNLYNAHIDRPAVLELAGEPAGLRVLDLGCGAGFCLAELRSRGAAECVGVDGSATLLAHARDRLGEGPDVRLHRHDLEEPLAFLPDDGFDLAVMSLVHHHVEARARLLREVRRVLRPGGALVASTTHPTADWGHFGGSYFDEGRVSKAVGDTGLAISYRRMTAATFLNELLDAGFALERVTEPRPVEAGRRVDEERYRRQCGAPSFLAARVRKVLAPRGG